MIIGVGLRSHSALAHPGKSFGAEKATVTACGLTEETQILVSIALSSSGDGGGCDDVDGRRHVFVQNWTCGSLVSIRNSDGCSVELSARPAGQRLLLPLKMTRIAAWRRGQPVESHTGLKKARANLVT
jgi:hypothetical protein